MFLAGLLTVAAAGAAPSPADSPSEQRVGMLQQFIGRFFQQNPLDTDEAAVAEAVLAEFARQDTIPLTPQAPALAAEHSRKAAQETAERLVKERFVPLDLEKLAKEAEERYPIHQKGDMIRIWYSANPVRPAEAYGPYKGRTTDAVYIGRHKILLQDIAAQPQNRGELLKFDHDASMRLRARYVQTIEAEHNAEKDAYAQKVMALALEAEERFVATQNENNGYILLDGAWLPVREVARRLAQKTRDAMLSRQRTAQEAQRLERERRVVLAVTSQALADQLGPELNMQDPVALLALLKPGVDGMPPANADGDGTPLASSDARPTPPDTTRPGTTEFAPPRIDAQAEDEAGSWWRLAIIALVLATIAGVGFFSFSGRPVTRKADARFKDGGAMQRSIWERAEADPDNFKYVAYVFSTERTAREALLGLSYIKESTGNQLACDEDILFGYYPQKDKFVVYVGGENLGYAMWREAMATFPELPDSEYFRVSGAPQVRLEVPDMGELKTLDDVRVEYVENREGEGDDFAHYRYYRAPDRKNALSFLDRVVVKSPGVKIVVETPEGTWGKDINGMYQVE